MAIGTAQPTTEELAAAKHYFIANREPEEDYNCGKYEADAIALLEKLFDDNDYVVAVGGSGLYIQALCSGIDALPEADEKLRTKLASRLHSEGLSPLAEELRRLDPEYAASADMQNPARVMRALEVCLTSGRPYSEQRHGTTAERNFNIIKIGVDMPRDILYDRINRRVDIMIADGLVEEARSMLSKRELNALQTVGYRELFDHFSGEISLDEAIDLIKRNSRRYAKRQMTWFRRDESIKWIAPDRVDEIIAYIDAKILQN
jgi:tRNA dimethylallyltransferase